MFRNRVNPRKELADRLVTDCDTIVVSAEPPYFVNPVEQHVQVNLAIVTCAW